MKISITDSKGDSISITIADNGTFQELNKQLDAKERSRTESAALENERQGIYFDRNIPGDISNDHIALVDSENFLDDEDHNSNVQILKKAVTLHLNEMEAIPGADTALSLEQHEEILPDVYNFVKIDREINKELDTGIRIKCEEGTKTSRQIRGADVKLAILTDDEKDEVSRSERSLNLSEETNTLSALLCRLCASPGKDMVHIFGSDAPYKNLIKKIKDCLPVIVKRMDALPKQVCRSCVKKLESCYQFQKLAAEAEKQLLALGGQLSHRYNKADECSDHIDESCETEIYGAGKQGTESSAEVRNIQGPLYEVKAETSISVPNSPMLSIHSEEESIFEEEAFSSNTYSASFIKSDELLNSERKEFWEFDNDESLGEDKKYSADCTESITHKKPKRRLATKSCKDCGRKFVSAARLQFHQIYHKPDTKPCYCEKCDKTMESESILYKHIQTVHGMHEQFSCNICGKHYRMQAQVNAHQRKHRYERSFDCTMCNKIFYSLETLELHKETHFRSPSNKGNYSCLYCGKAFARKTQLIDHIMAHNEERPYSCDLCDGAYITRQERDNHRRTHTGDQPIKCAICEKTFTHTARLREHSSVHTGKRPYKCPLCNKSFKRANARKVHMFTHTDEKPYECDLCGTHFRRAGDMRRHRKTQHKKSE